MIIPLVLFADCVSLCIPFPVLKRMNLSQGNSQKPVKILKYKVFETIQTKFYVSINSFCHNYVQSVRGDGVMTGLCD